VLSECEWIVYIKSKLKRLMIFQWVTLEWNCVGLLLASLVGTKCRGPKTDSNRVVYHISYIICVLLLFLVTGGRVTGVDNTYLELATRYTVAHWSFNCCRIIASPAACRSSSRTICPCQAAILGLRLCPSLRML
jgi:hypothetical protein